MFLPVNTERVSLTNREDTLLPAKFCVLDTKSILEISSLRINLMSDQAPLAVFCRCFYFLFIGMSCANKEAGKVCNFLSHFMPVGIIWMLNMK